jgi:hypothetical protein
MAAKGSKNTKKYGKKYIDGPLAGQCGLTGVPYVSTLKPQPFYRSIMILC